MAIIIPSKSIYKKDNKKVIDNEITGVSYSENTYSENRETLYENSNVISSSLSPTQTLTNYSEWVNESSSVRKRYVVETLIYSDLFQFASEKNIKVSDLKMLLNITTTGNLNGKNLSAYEHYPKYSSKLETIENEIPLPTFEEHLEIADFCNKIIIEKTKFGVAIDEPMVLLLGWVGQINVSLQVQTLLNETWADSSITTIINPKTSILSSNLFLDYSSITSTPINIGNEKSSLSLNSNEFLQADTLINNIPIGEYISQKILNDYKQGKETATILCSINNYFDENGEKVISINSDRMSFRMYDEVIPYIYTADGTDTPMSKNKDGMPKKFIVVGSKIYYDGAVWQELHLIES